MQLTLYDFTIHYQKEKLNSADESSQRSDYIKDVKTLNTVIAKLMSILLNKLAAALFKADEQSDVKSCGFYADDIEENEGFVNKLLLKFVTDL